MTIRRGAFLLEKLNAGEMNIAGVTIAELNIDLSAKRRAIAAVAVNAQPLTVGSGSKPVRLGRRRRRLEASDKLLGRVVAGSVRNGVFSSTDPRSCRPTDWIAKLNQAANAIDRDYWAAEKRKWPLNLLMEPDPALGDQSSQQVHNSV